MATNDRVAFYWLGWKDHDFEYKPTFQLLKELYDEERDKLYNVVEKNDWTPVPLVYDGNSSDDDSSYDDLSEDDSEDGGLDQDYAFYDQTIYKKFTYT